MRNRILTLILAIMLCFAMLCPLCVQAATPLDTDAQASLTLHYRKDGVAFADLCIEIYRVAQATADGSFHLIAPFATYPINIHGITTQEQWQSVAETLCAYIVADQVAPDCEKQTDEEGSVYFSDLETGLYFVREVVAENASGTYVFNQFMVYVPTPQQDGSYLYAVDAKPKCTGFVPKDHYSVTKLWQDGDNQALRPKAVTVEIYRDGVLYETQILSADNNWTYTWSVSGDQGKWTVVEKSVPDDYKVTIRQKGNNFSIINTHQTTQDGPQTGDTFTPLPWILAMCFSGFMLMLLGIYGRRSKE